MFSKVLRRSHMYAALFLTPWILMYAISTMAMNHREWFKRAYGEAPPAFTAERETRFEGVLPDGDAKARGAVLLASLGMEGAFNTQTRKADGALIVNRANTVTPRRITYTPGDGRVLVEKQEFRANAFLERMHRRRGYQQPFLADTLWAACVDLTIAAMLFWALSGLWMWWEMKATRNWGALAALSGAALFAFYLAVL